MYFDSFLIILGNCKICYYAASAADIELTGKSLATSKKGKGRFKDTLCCGNFGTDGKKTSSAGKTNLIILMVFKHQTKVPHVLPGCILCSILLFVA